MNTDSLQHFKMILEGKQLDTLKLVYYINKYTL